MIVFRLLRRPNTRQKRGKNGDHEMAKIIHSKILGGWYVCRGPHNTPISGRFPSRAAAEGWLQGRKS